MAEPVATEIETAAIVRERAGVLALARAKCRAIDGAISERRMSADEGTEAKRWINGFAGDVAIGLHVEGADDAGVRAAMKAVCHQPNQIRHGTAVPGERASDGSSPFVAGAQPHPMTDEMIALGWPDADPAEIRKEWDALSTQYRALHVAGNGSILTMAVVEGVLARLKQEPLVVGARNDAVRLIEFLAEVCVNRRAV